MDVPDRPLDPAFEIAPMHQAGVTAHDVIALWERDRVVVGAEARRRVDEVLLVATMTGSTELVGVSTVALQRSQQLRVDLWSFRTYVVPSSRMGNIAVQLLDRARSVLEARFVTGEDTRGAGVLIEVENEGVKRAQPQATWPQTGFTYIGDSDLGAHRRVRFFPGAVVG